MERREREGERKGGEKREGGRGAGRTAGREGGKTEGILVLEAGYHLALHLHGAARSSCAHSLWR